MMNLAQGPQSVEEYTLEFEHMILKYDLQEDEEITVARYLKGLRGDIGDMVSLQYFDTFNEDRRLAIRLEINIKNVQAR